MMRKDITITLERAWTANRPAAFRVAYEWSDPKVTAAIVNRIGGFFIAENVRERAQEADGTSEFLDNQLAESKRNLQQQEAKLSAFKVEHTGELPQQEATLLASMAQSRAELVGAQDSQGRAEQNRLILENSLEAAKGNLKRLQEAGRKRAAEGASPVLSVQPESGIPAVPRAPTELERARQQLRSLRTRYEEKYPEIERLKEDVERLEKEERQHPVVTAPQRQSAQPARLPTMPAVESDLPPADNLVETERIQTLESQIAQSKSDIASLEVRRTRILQEVAEFQRRLQSLPVREQELAAITRDYESSRTNYRSLLDKKMAADVAANMERGQKAEKLVMLDQARVPEKPAHARQIPYSMGGALFSLVLAGGLAFVLELRRHTFLGEWELPSGTTVLCRIPPLQTQNL